MLLPFGVTRFHLLVLITWQLSIFFASQQIFPIFANYSPKFRCPNTTDFTRECSEMEKCSRRELILDEIVFQSALLEFDWLCGDNAYRASLFSTVQFLGVLFGTIVHGTASDRWGRRPVSLFALSNGLIFSVASGLAPNWQLLMMSRFCIGFSIGGVLVTVCAFVMELLLPQQRMALRAFFNWGVARLMVTGLCIVFPAWRPASFACAIVALPALLIIYFVFPESPTWLHNQGRLEEMARSERKMARIAGQKYQPSTTNTKIEHREGLSDLFKQSGLRSRLLVLWGMWFTASVCGYANDLNSGAISGRFFLNQVLFSVLIAVSKILLVLLDTAVPQFNRRHLHQGAQTGVIVCFLILTVLLALHHQGVAILVINLIGTVFIEYTWDACYLCAVEAMPTAVRASAMGSCSLMARVGAVLSPTLTHLSRLWSPSAYLAVTIIGSFNLIASYCFLPDTKNIILDQVHVDDQTGNIEHHHNADEAVAMLSKK